MFELENPVGPPSGELEVIARQLDDGIVLEVRGEIDLATARIVEQKLLRAEEAHDLVALDLTETSFIDSTGLHVIVAASRRLRGRGGRLVVVEGPPQVRRLFDVTGLANHLELVRDATDLERVGVIPR
jgi:anti-anti-sigma factor